MTTTTTQPESEANILAAIAVLDAVRDTFKRDLRPYEERRRLSANDEAAKRDLQLTLLQIEEGVADGEGVDARLDAVLKRPEITRLARVVRPSLASFRRLLARVRAEREQREADAADAKTWPRAFKLKAGALKAGARYLLGDGRELEPGETILLARSTYLACQDRFEPAGPKDPPPVNRA
jgi:hypothetical protein